MSTEVNLVMGSSVEAWREWLAANSQAEPEAWLVIQHKNSGVPGIRIEEAMEQALCFGWIDGLHQKHDAEQLAAAVLAPASGQRLECGQPRACRHG